MKYLSAILILLMIVVSFGCSSPTVVSPHSRAGLQSPDGAAGEGDREGEGITEEELAKAERARLARQQEALDRERAQARQTLFRDILFEYDSYTIEEQALPRLKDIARWLEGRKGVGLTVEGHCDERGTQEYNLVLGQKRADAVKEYLTKLGVEGSGINAVSYGKEAPLDPGHTEDAWAKNRRVHFNLE